MSEVKLKVIREFYNTELNKNMAVGEEFTTPPERAKTIMEFDSKDPLCEVLCWKKSQKKINTGDPKPTKSRGAKRKPTT